LLCEEFRFLLTLILAYIYFAYFGVMALPWGAAPLADVGICCLSLCLELLILLLCVLDAPICGIALLPCLGVPSLKVWLTPAPPSCCLKYFWVCWAINFLLCEALVPLTGVPLPTALLLLYP
jgi:hypothetical protein